ncbi:ABC transporter permease [Leucobacter allii]|uniref:ABC transporter permease n=1 Tax=Leucobacter allii TaxID=2932247 RepID=UPI001FD21A1F|nr:ABC transporter permease [Leucobacter allii]UOR01358.1 ABC transporter permease [Leucobacter allii]
MKGIRNRVSPQVLILLGVIVLVVLLFSIMSPGYLSPKNISNILLQASATTIAAAGMTLVITAGWIDLSVGSVINFSMVVALAASGVRSASSGDSNAGTYFIVIGIALAAGAVNALLIQFLKVHPLLVTLGTLTLYRGLALHFTNAGNWAADGPIQALGRSQVLGIPGPVITALVVVIAADFVLRKTVLGRYIVAIGGSERSAHETALPIKRVRVAVYAISALCAGIAGIIIVGRIGTLQSSLGEGYEFTVITAVIVGGTSLFGGKGSVVGAALGAVLLVLIDNGLNRVDASIYIYDVVRGAVLVAAVLLDSSVTERLRRLQEKRQHRKAREAAAAT